MEEKELISKAKDGDVYSFERLISQHQKKIYNVIYNMIGDESEAYDISQEVFIKAFKYMKEFRGDSTFFTWLYSIARNIFLNESKRFYNKKRNFETSLDNNDNIELLKISDNYNIDKELESNELQKKVREAIQQLPEEFKLVIIFYYLEGFSYEDIAGVMELSIGTVKSRLSRGKEHLKEIFSNIADFQEFDSECASNNMII
ncbi:MAG: hypothetical protein A2474_04645 [Elusimicrobia bacterium RIFOXYC2_FULL_34_12]|nr:MAG: hypothetical protein A2474_04645 [Elusimicrobia bacterium RIFOXYC2_FULL_34_12]